MSTTTITANQTNQQLVEKCLTFLREYYREDIGQLAESYPNEQRSLWIEWSDLYQSDPDVAQDYLDQPDLVHHHLKVALGQFDLPVDIDISEAHIRVTDSGSYITRKGVSDLVATDIQEGPYLAVEGQLSKVTAVSYRLEELAFECQRCGTLSYMPQSRTSVQEPHECHSCERQGPFVEDLQESTLVDQRKLKLEEPPEDRAQSEGTSIPVYVEDDLCHYGGEHGLADHAGERVVVFGRYRGDTGSLQARNADPEIDGWFEAKAIEFAEDDLSNINLEAYREEIQAYAAGEHGDPVELCKESIVPRLEITDELDTVLEAAVAWLFNSYRIDPEGRDQIRGDLHMALIGDPATGKSSVLSNLNRIAPQSEFRSGTGLSKVGLTAAAKQEEFAGKSEWTLEPGILPRANGGHCIIDEVDDVIDEQTKAIHDALEGEQMVKIDKAGISADLPTRTALLASGNPVHGRFDRHNSIPQQIDLDPALVSRMDVLLALEDEINEDRDTRVAEHVLEAYQELSEAEIAERTPGEEAPEAEATNRPVPIDVFRHWVYLAREECFPKLTDEASEVLRDFYLEIRDLNDGYSEDDGETIPATPRSLEAGIRLATAFARVELSDTVEPEHAERAVKISRQVVGLNYDPESGEFDVNRVDTGKPESQKERRNLLYDIVDELEEEYDDDGVPIQEVTERAVEAGIAENQAEHDISQMARGRRSAFYQPTNDTVRTA